MNYALILAGGVGQRMRTSGMPKQFLELYGKPIIMYTISKFDACQEIDHIVVACNTMYIDFMQELLKRFPLTTKISVIAGGKDRQGSIQNGIDFILQNGGTDEDLIVIHDGVRPLIEKDIISENIRIAAKEGCAMTVHPVVESMIVTETENAGFADIKKRDDTYSITSPQTFKLGIILWSKSITLT